jgi:hypothetical protein
MPQSNGSGEGVSLELAECLQTLREVLRFGNADDMRMPLEDGECPQVHSGSPEAKLIFKIRFQSKALGHVSVAFQKIWGTCASLTLQLPGSTTTGAALEAIEKQRC